MILFIKVKQFLMVLEINLILWSVNVITGILKVIVSVLWHVQIILTLTQYLKDVNIEITKCVILFLGLKCPTIYHSFSCVWQYLIFNVLLFLVILTIIFIIYIFI